MTVFLRKWRAHDIIEGREPREWNEDDYAVIDGTLLGRIYRERLPGGEKWMWFVVGPLFPTIPPAIQSRGIADTLEEAKAALAGQYLKVRPLK